ncbi:DOPA 4,5-dioxygenase [Bdellovibrio sp. qaytius]|nr:DOPA 4,5-dioxygenase [Bdellovibrio sp. qaytius]
MKTRTYRYNSEWMPKGFLHDWDAHIYYIPEQIDVIERLRSMICTEFKNDEIFVGDIIPEPIGPHTLPMLEVNFSQAQYYKLVPWLDEYRESLNILVHPQDGTDYDNHTAKALWLGQPVRLKLEVFK